MRREGFDEVAAELAGTEVVDFFLPGFGVAVEVVWMGGGTVRGRGVAVVEGGRGRGRELVGGGGSCSTKLR